MGIVKIYGTIGPACRDKEIMKQMFREGMDGVRLNLSHTSLADAADLIRDCREAAIECGRTPELLIDMQGPELRVGDLESPLSLTGGALVGLGYIPLPDVVSKVLEDCGPGQEVLLDDGKILLITEDTEAENGICMRVVRGGLLESRKSVALPGRVIRTPAMTENDRVQISNAKAFGVTAVMQPFVRSKEDLLEVRNALDEAGCKDIRLLAR